MFLDVIKSNGFYKSMSLLWAARMQAAYHYAMSPPRSCNPESSNPEPEPKTLNPKPRAQRCEILPGGLFQGFAAKDMRLARRSMETQTDM